MPVQLVERCRCRRHCCARRMHTLVRCTLDPFCRMQGVKSVLCAVQVPARGSGVLSEAQNHRQQLQRPQFRPTATAVYSRQARLLAVAP